MTDNLTATIKVTAGIEELLKGIQTVVNEGNAEDFCLRHAQILERASQSILSTLANADSGMCKHCNFSITKTDDVWFHTFSGRAGCTYLEGKFAEPK
jgi:hypothetical protein